ncbi:MAG TPA: hypothetical protein ENJ80_05590, partial [Gammaproteobacteria bacterium]|nr:hypothetical protein [Gammaproteobacteria bacterium]
MQQITFNGHFRLLWLLSLLLPVLALNTGCATDQVHAKVQYEEISLTGDDLASHGLGFITPSTVTGQEQDIQSLAFIFAHVLEKERPDVRVIGLPEALSAINRA